jgi:hypothetical protein
MQPDSSMLRIATLTTGTVASAVTRFGLVAVFVFAVFLIAIIVGVAVVMAAASGGPAGYRRGLTVLVLVPSASLVAMVFALVFIGFVNLAVLVVVDAIGQGARNAGSGAICSRAAAARW